MDAPSKSLRALADTPEPGIQAILIEWGQLLKKLRIKESSRTGLSSSSHELAEALDIGWEQVEIRVMFEISIYSTVQEFLDSEVADENLILVQFFPGNTAVIKGNGGTQFLGEPCDFRGTWEEVARKLFEMEKLMFSQIPPVPEDLKS